VKGRKRHLAVDSLGLPLAVVVTGAQVQDSQPAAVARLFVASAKDAAACPRSIGSWPKLHEVFADKNYRGTADLWAKHEGFSLQRVERKGKGFEKLPKRWVIERSFSWLFTSAGCLFDLEYKITTARACCGSPQSTSCPAAMAKTGFLDTLSG